MPQIHFIDRNAPKGSAALCGAVPAHHTHILNRVTCKACLAALQK